METRGKRRRGSDPAPEAGARALADFAASAARPNTISRGGGGGAGGDASSSLTAGERAELARYREDHPQMMDTLRETLEALAELRAEVGEDAGAMAIAALLKTADGQRHVAEKLALKIAEGVKAECAAKNWYQAATRPHLKDDVIGYSHAAWNAANAGGLAWLLQYFLCALFTAVAPASASTLGADVAGRAARTARFTATATACVYACSSVHFVWMFGVLQSVYLRCKSNSREVVDVAAATTPGAPKYTAVMTMCAAWVACWELSFVMTARTMILLLMDNVGRYRLGTSRMQATAVARPVNCNAAAVHFTGMGEEVQNLMKRPELSPQVWQLEWETTPDNIYKLETTARHGEDRSESEILDAQGDAFVLRAFQDLGAKRDAVAGTWSDAITEAFPRRADEPEVPEQQPDAEDMVELEDGRKVASRDAKVCEACKTPWYKSTRHCGYCGYALQGIELQREASKKEPSDEDYASRYATRAAPLYHGDKQSMDSSLGEKGERRRTLIPRENPEASEAGGSGRLQVDIQTLPFHGVNPQGQGKINFLVGWCNISPVLKAHWFGA